MTNFDDSIYKLTEGQWCETPEQAYVQGVKTALMHYQLQKKQAEALDAQRKGPSHLFSSSEAHAFARAAKIAQAAQKRAELQDPSTLTAHPPLNVMPIVSPSDQAKELSSALAKARAGQKKLQSMALKGRS